MERMEGLTNRIRRLVHQDLQKAGQNPKLDLLHVLEAILLQSTLRDIRNETLLRYMEKKALVDTSLFAKILCDVMEEHVDMMQDQLGIIVDDNGQLVLDRIH